MKRYIGVCLGASSISYAVVAGSTKNGIIVETVGAVAHNGEPRRVFLEILAKINAENSPVVVTGRKLRHLVALPKISEPEATEIAFDFLIRNKKDYSAIASLGGETFMVYSLDPLGKISGVVTKNQCASGTGEFFLQQIKRMDLSLDESMEIAVNAEPHKVSGRCSVFCKSDCTHALNKGISKSEVTAGLSLMIAEKVEELLKKNSNGKVLLAGGVTNNIVVMDFIKSKFPNAETAKFADSFEAMGAALYGMSHNIKAEKDHENFLLSKESPFSFHPPLSKYQDLVIFKESTRGIAIGGEKCILGLDVGSTTTKAVLINIENSEILASVYLYTNGNPIGAAKDCYKSLLSQIPDNIEIIGIGTTGSGRQIAGLHALTEGIVNEIIAHATAAVFYDPEVDTIFEIGGQDAKYTYMVNKVPADYAMNEACSAGTGSFIEESAHESLGIDVKDIEAIAMRGMKPPNFSDQCAAFISSDIKTALQENIDREDIVAGLVYSICMNYVNRVKGNRPIGKKIFMQGGVCYNKAIPIAMAGLTGNQIIVPPEPGLMGAFGVALVIKEKIELGLIKPGSYDLKELSERDVTYHKQFICSGGKEKCDIKCPISMIEVRGNKYPFGGACNKYYNLLQNEDYIADDFDFVKIRHHLTFEKFAKPVELPANALSIGINNSFHIHTAYPLFYNFFTRLGVRVILSDKVHAEGLDREMTSFCYPAQLSLGLFQDLVNKKPDFYFLPTILEMYVEDAEYHRMDFNCSCVFVSGESMFLSQAYKDNNIKSRILSPNITFANGFDSQESEFVKIAESLGIKDQSIAIEAYHYAVDMQEKYQEELFSVGRDFLKYLDNNPDEFAIVLVGRPYNSFTDLANKGIPKKFASRGIHIVPFDIFDYREESVDDNMYWESGKKILKVAKIIKTHPQLFATYISNFSCGPDSLIMTTFRNIMGSKPSLTLELDSHSADAGINTRIDAALDIIKNYRKLSGTIEDPDFSDFTAAKVYSDGQNGWFVNSDGHKMLLSDKSIDIIIPSMGDLAASLFAAALRSLGFNAKPMREPDADLLRFGRSSATGKECLPLVLLAGHILDYIDKEWDGEKSIVLFNVQGAGNCRLGQYPVFLRDLIKRNRLKNVAQMTLMNEDGFAGFGPDFAMRGIQAIIASDVLDDVRNGILANALDPEDGMKVYDSEYAKLVLSMENTPKDFYKSLEKFSAAIKEQVEEKTNIEDSKYIALLGEIYVRRDGFSHKWLNRYFAKQGFIIKDAYISEWIFYVDYLLQINLLEPEKSFKKKMERNIRAFFMRSAEKKIKKALEKSGYYKYSKTEIEPIMKHSKHIIPLDYKGEPGITLGIALHEGLEKYCGIINLGPFGCMPTRLCESVTQPEMFVKNKIEAKRLHNPSFKMPEIFNRDMSIPFLTIETDGNAYPQVIEARLETFTIQAERAAKIMRLAKDKLKANGNGHIDISNFEKDDDIIGFFPESKYARHKD